MLGERSEQRGLWEADRLVPGPCGAGHFLRSDGITAGPVVPGRRFRGVLLLRHPQDGADPNWFAKRPRFHIHFTPTSASWLNLVGAGLGCSPKSSCAGECIRAAANWRLPYRYLDVTNEDPKPCWTKTADHCPAAPVSRQGQRRRGQGQSGLRRHPLEEPAPGHDRGWRWGLRWRIGPSPRARCRCSAPS